MSRRLRIGFFCAKNYLDEDAFSGALLRMYRALTDQQIELVDLGQPKKLDQSFPSRTMRRLVRRFARSRPSERDLTRFARSVERQIQSSNCDVIFAPMTMESLRFLQPGVPFIYLSDATPELLREQGYCHFADEAHFARAEKWESEVISRAARLIYTSDGVAESAIKRYRAKPEKIKIVCFGPNVDRIPAANVVEARLADQGCRLLLVGKNWHRKGADIACQIVPALRDRGIEAELTVVGCVPPQEYLNDGVKIIRYLDKKVDEQRVQFEQLFVNSHFLVLPTRGDCTPFVFSEASAYGLPVVTADVGGVRSVIDDGCNGLVLPSDSDPNAYADAIAHAMADREAYRKLVHGAREQYESHLNWDHWAKQVVETAAACVAESNQLNNIFDHTGRSPQSVVNA